MNIPQNINGQATMANSQPVVLPSDQSTIPILIDNVKFTVNAANSRTAELAAGEIFTGTIVNVTTGEPNIQLSISTDQPLEVQLLQYNDAGGLEPLPTIHYDVPPFIGLNQNLNLTGNYYQVNVQNKGIATTTTFNLITSTGMMSVGARNYIAPPLGTDEGMGVRPIPQINWRTTFARVLGSTWDTEFWARVSLGSGTTNSQSSGNGVITAGTTANSETILRSRRSFNGSFLLRAQTILSQRIINQNFVVELVDVIGDGLVLTAVSATSCTVTIPNNPFTSENVGQSMNIGAIVAGTIPGTLVPGRYAIASVSGNDVTFTVAGWTGATSGTGTCSLFGRNYHQLIYSGTTATNVLYNAAINGWASGTTTATINTTAAPGHLALMGSDDGNAFLADQLIASSTTLPIVTRASRAVNIADETTDLWLQIRVLNGSTAPASGTTWTIGTIAIENYATQQVTVANNKVMGSATAQSVRIENSPTVTVTQATATNLNAAVIGLAAHSAASSGNPVRIGGRVLPATPDLTLVAGDVSDLGITTGQQALFKPYAAGEQDFTFNGTIINSAAAIPFKAAAGASIRNWLTSLTLTADALATATEVVIRDGDLAGSGVAANVFTTASHDLKVGDQVVFTTINTFTGAVINTPYWVLTVPLATTFTLSASPNGSTLAITGTGTFTIHRVLYRTKLQTAALTPTQILFPTPLRGAPNAVMNIQGITASATGTIYYNVAGYVGF